MGLIREVIVKAGSALKEHLCLPQDDAKVRALRAAAERAFPGEKVSVEVFRSGKRAWVTHDDCISNVVEVYDHPRAYEAALAACRALAQTDVPASA